jgi:protease-4
MSLDADHIVDRRRMRRKLTFWRVVAVLLVVGGIAALASFGTRGVASLSEAGSGSIARVKITGLIRGDQDRTEALDRLGKSGVRAVIVHIDSPGGTTAGAEQLHDSLIQLKAKKPMVVVVDGLAASGGYIAALASDHIIAQSASLVGSIGVLVQYPNVSDLLKTVGVKVEEIKSSPLKAAPNGFEPTSPEARAALAAVVMDSYEWFKKLVGDTRKMDTAALDKVSDGRIFTGRQAIELKLIDELGNEKTAIAWLAKRYPCGEASSGKNCVPADSPVRDYRLKPRLGDLPFLHVAAGAVLEAVGLTGLARRLEESGILMTVERLNLDGLLALWHPVTGN